MNASYENRVADYSFRDDDSGRIPLKCAPHLHVHIEFFYLLEGSTRAFVDSEEYTVCAGDLLIAFPNRVHHFDEVEREKYLLFIVHPDLVPELSHVFGKQMPESAVIRRACEDRALVELLYLLRDAIKSGDAYRDVRVKGLLLALFGQMLPKLPLSEPHGEDSHAMRDIVNYCTENFTSDLSLEVLEDALHLSRYYISHLFSHKLGIRFTDYVNSLRVSEACRLLRQSDDSITDVCARAGFNTLRTFNRSFMKQMGSSPSEYRRACSASKTKRQTQGENDHE